MAEENQLSVDDRAAADDRVEVTVDTPIGSIVFAVEQKTPERRVTSSLVERLREIGASSELLDFAERTVVEDARAEPA